MTPELITRADLIAQLLASMAGVHEDLLASNVSIDVPRKPLVLRSRLTDEPKPVATEGLQPLEKVVAGPWRSLGGFLDYSGWEDRDRFLELDKAIAKARYAGGREEDWEEELN